MTILRVSERIFHQEGSLQLRGDFVSIGWARRPRRKMRIGQLVLENPLVLAPMAGHTDLPLRLIAKRRGCALVCSEMVSADGLVRGNARTKRLLGSCREERPLAVQIFGSDPRMMAEAAAIAAGTAADVLDINLGCSVRKIVRNGAGVALMREPERTEAVLKSVRKVLDIPLTVKLRSGWIRSGEQCLTVARIAQDCGVDAISVHPRTATQGFAGKADWALIGRVKETVSIPVIGNGDVRTAHDVLRMLEETGCDAVMIGRAAVTNPWIFAQALALFHKRAPEQVTIEQHFEMMTEYVEKAVQHYGEGTACRMMRGRLCWFTKGLPDRSWFRESVKRVSNLEQARAMIRSYHARLRERGTQCMDCCS
ncbi:tRNA dihydrouridine synthase DusB [Thermodesulfobacteriota bacterium]